MARALATTILLFCGCTEHARPAPVPAPGPAPVASTPAPAAPPALELSPVAAAEPVQVSIQQPAPGQRLALADVAATPINVHSARPDWLMELALDGRRLRPLAALPEKPTLGDLSEGVAIGAGAHYLVAALRAVENGPARSAATR